MVMYTWHVKMDSDEKLSQNVRLQLANVPHNSLETSVHTLYIGELEAYRMSML